MLEYAKELMDAGSFDQAVSLLEQLMATSEVSQYNILDIHVLLQKCYSSLQNYGRSVVYGEMVKQLAQDSCEWDVFGGSCRDLGYAYYRLGQQNEAVVNFQLYLSKTADYSNARLYETAVWHSLGVIYRSQGDLHTSVLMFERALEAAIDRGDERMQHGMRHTLIQAYLDIGKTVEVPRLMAKCSSYLRRLENDPAREEKVFSQSRVRNRLLRVKFAITTKRYQRALLIATGALCFAHQSTGELTEVHLQLAEGFAGMGHMQTALTHAQAAIAYAREAKNVDHEVRAVKLAAMFTR